jgi:phage terminase Nu1 subunit (DNA packaging protein)
MKDEALSASQLGKLIGVTPRRVQQLAREQVIPRVGQRYPLRAAVRSYCAWLRDRATGRDDDPARQRLTLARAEMAELELAKRRGELVEVDAVLALDADRNIRARQVLEAFPGRLAPSFVGETDRVAIEDRLREVAGELAAQLERALTPR